MCIWIKHYYYYLHSTINVPVLYRGPNRRQIPAPRVFYPRFDKENQQRPRSVVKASIKRGKYMMKSDQIHIQSNTILSPPTPTSQGLGSDCMASLVPGAGGLNWQSICFHIHCSSEGWASVGWQQGSFIHSFARYRDALGHLATSFIYNYRSGPHPVPPPFPDALSQEMEWWHPCGCGGAFGQPRPSRGMPPKRWNSCSNTTPCPLAGRVWCGSSGLFALVQGSVALYKAEVSLVEWL